MDGKPWGRRRPVAPRVTIAAMTRHVRPNGRGPASRRMRRDDPIPRNAFFAHAKAGREQSRPRVDFGIRHPITNSSLGLR